MAIVPIASRPKQASLTWLVILCLAAIPVLAGTISAIFGGVVALAVTVGLTVLVLTVLDFRIGLVMSVMLLPFENTAFLPATTGFNLNYYFSVITLTVLFVGYRFKKLQVAEFPAYVVWLYLIPLVLAWLLGYTNLGRVPELFILQTGQDAFSSSKKYLAEMLVKPLLFVLMAWLAACAVANSKRPERWLLLVVVAPVFPAASMLMYLPMTGYSLTFLASPQARYIYANVGLHTTQYGLLFASAFAIQLFLFGALKGWLKVGLALCMMIVAAALILSFSRVGYLAAAIAAVALLISQRRLSNYLAVLAGITIAFAFLGDFILQRISTGVEASLSDSYSPAAGMSGQELTAGRVYIWAHLLPEVWQSPIIGSGLGSTMWSEALRRGTIPASHPHNIYLGMLLDMGLIGLGAVLAFYFKLYSFFRRLANDPTLSPLFRAAFTGALLAFVGFLVSGIGDNRYYPVREQTYLWLMFGIGLGLAKKQIKVDSSSNGHAPLTRERKTVTDDMSTGSAPGVSPK